VRKAVVHSGLSDLFFMPELKIELLNGMELLGSMGLRGSEGR
jgi:hypothetical protein